MWRDKMQDASFRGVPFFVDDDSTPFGRKTQVHEFPQRDSVLVEDLGRKGRVFAMTAWVAGDDAFEKRDALLSAIEEEGAGELIHPWLGTVTVTPTDCTVSHERSSGGYVKFDLTFVECGDELPAVNESTVASLTDSISDLEELSKLDFVTNILAAIDEYGSIDALTDYFREYSKLLSPYISGLDDIASVIDKIVNSPLDFAESIYAMVAGGSGHLTQFSNIFKKASDRYRSFGELLKVNQKGITKTVNTLVLDASISSSLRDVVAIAPEQGSTVVSKERTVDVSTSDVDLSHILTGNISNPAVANVDIDSLLNSIDKQMLDLMYVSESTRYQTLNRTRISMIKHLKNVSVSAYKIARREFQHLPALVHSYDLYETAARAGEIVIRNKQKHPSFVGGKLEVVDE